MSGFIGNALVKVRGGSKKISEITKGDFVISAITKTPTKVLAVYKQTIKTRLCGFNNNNFAVFTHCFFNENNRYSYQPDLSIHNKHWDIVYPLIDIYENITISKNKEYTIYNLVTEDHTYIVNNYGVWDDFFDLERFEIEVGIIYNVIKEIKEMGFNDRIDEYIERSRNKPGNNVELVELLEDEEMMKVMEIIWRDYLNFMKIIFH